MNWLIWLLLKLSHGTPRIIWSRDGKEPYLVRYFLTRHSYKTEGMGQSEGAPGWGLYLHHFCRSDDGAELHSHPWKWAVSWVLTGGYSEERRCRCDVCNAWVSQNWPVAVMRRKVKPWRLNLLTSRDFHRVDVPPGGAWTLFLVGPIVGSWGFWDRMTGVFTPWKKFLGVK